MYKVRFKDISNLEELYSELHPQDANELRKVTHEIEKIIEKIYNSTEEAFEEARKAIATGRSTLTMEKFEEWRAIMLELRDKEIAEMVNADNLIIEQVD